MMRLTVFVAVLVLLSTESAGGGLHEGTMTLLSWICRQVWGYTVLAAIVAGWFLGWKAGAAGAVLAYGVAMLALWEKPRPVVLSVRPDRRGRDYFHHDVAALTVEGDAEAVKAAHLRDEEATAAFNAVWWELFPDERPNTQRKGQS
jgi:hypothetical protein